jgi:hypothetical protein
MEARFVDVTANKYYYFLLAGMFLLVLDILLQTKTIRI